eukprot:CAMPEP_0115056352 /NCGR_PEP_ID=MMETSP0227-20121206/5143_1 /TAXON_ID=89957 /ORGANISM="Polarella glacialis, Strain CCMP 1383" /LENGTH=373 /DNA_ID=CAMNT_0002441011 /DNA_START=182 /DNA_END=1303 /DNA_ORIENTATION=+
MDEVVHPMSLMLLFRTKQAEVVEGHGQDAGAHNTPSRNNPNALELHDNLIPIAIDGAAGAPNFLCGQEACHQRPEHATHPVHGEHGDDVVHAGMKQHPEHEHLIREVADHSCPSTDRHGTGRSDEARRWGGCAEAGHGAAHEVEGCRQVAHAQPAVGKARHAEPANGTCGASQEGVHHCGGCPAPGGVGRASVEAKPANEEQGSTNDVEHSCFFVWLIALLLSRTHPIAQRERGDAGGGLHDKATCSVEDAPLLQDASAPDHVADGAVDNQKPNIGKDHDGPEEGSFGDGSDCDRSRDEAEGELEDAPRALWNARVDTSRAPVEESPLSAPDEAIGRSAEAQAVADEPVDQRDGSGQDHRLEHRVNKVLTTHQ